jgi:hypothetical protein
MKYETVGVVNLCKKHIRQFFTGKIKINTPLVINEVSEDLCDWFADKNDAMLSKIVKLRVD